MLKRLVMYPQIIRKRKEKKETSIKACIEFKFKEILHGIGREFTDKESLHEAEFWKSLCGRGRGLDEPSNSLESPIMLQSSK